MDNEEKVTVCYKTELKNGLSFCIFGLLGYDRGMCFRILTVTLAN